MLFLLFLVLAIGNGIRIANASAPSDQRDDAAQTASYIMLALFAALALVFGLRLLKRKR